MELDGAPISIEYELFTSADQLPQDEQELLSKAMEVADGAYAPYSGFLVGCALGLESGEILTANNQENIAYPSGLCAERTALFFAGAHGKGKDIRKIAVRGRSVSTEVNVPVTPCGACRQVMVEYEKLAGKPFTVIMQGEKGNILRIKGVSKSLVPFGFDIDF